MNTKQAAFERGASDALQAFGVRSERHTVNGAEHLAKTLGAIKDHYGTVHDGAAHKRLERPPLWSDRVSLESADSRYSYPGVRTFGGV